MPRSPCGSLARVGVERAIADRVEAARLHGRSADQQRADRRGHLAARGGLDLETQHERRQRETDAEQRDRGEQAAQAHAAGAHRDDLDVSRHASDREQHAEQERDRQRVDREHRAEQAHHAQHVFDHDARADQLIEHAHEAARDHHDRDRREADQRVGHDLARHVQGQGAGPAHSRQPYPFH